MRSRTPVRSAWRDDVAIDLVETGRLFVGHGTSNPGAIDFAAINAVLAAGGVYETSDRDLRRPIAGDLTASLLSAHATVERMSSSAAECLPYRRARPSRGRQSMIYAGIKCGIHGFAEALRREPDDEDIGVPRVESGKVGSHTQYPQIAVDSRRELINSRPMVRAEHVAEGARHVPTLPRRTEVQQLTLALLSEVKQ